MVAGAQVEQENKDNLWDQTFVKPAVQKVVTNTIYQSPHLKQR